MLLQVRRRVRFGSILRAGLGLKRRLAGLAPTVHRPDQEAFSTHLPILLGLARLTTVRSVLEFGAGRLSTPTFLRRDAFPHLERLRSYENDQEWLEAVRALVAGDERVELRWAEGPMADAARGERAAEYDLVFLDDSVEAAERSRTINTVALQRPPRAIAVVHDFENLVYREAAQPFQHSYRFEAYVPNTGVAWNGDTLSRQRLLELDRCIARFVREVEPDEVTRWVQIYAEHL